MIELNPKEKIILLRKRHGLILILEILPVALMIFGVLVALTFFGTNVIYIFAGGLVVQLLVAALMIMFTDYFLDTWVITNERVIHAELRGLFNRTLSSLPHDKVQDITVVTPGILATFFHFGDIQIQSAGAVPQVIMKQVPEPTEVKSVLLEAQQRLGREK